MKFREFVAQLREWFRPPRRLKFTRAGGLFTFGVIALGFATLNTGNNLLYLLLGALLGLIVVSGWLSEQALRNLRIVRRASRGTPTRLPRITNYTGGCSLPVFWPSTERRRQITKTARARKISALEASRMRNR